MMFGISDLIVFDLKAHSGRNIFRGVGTSTLAAFKRPAQWRKTSAWRKLFLKNFNHGHFFQPTQRPTTMNRKHLKPSEYPTPNVGVSAAETSDGTRTRTPNFDDSASTTSTVRPSRPPPVGARPVNGLAHVLPVPPIAPTTPTPTMPSSGPGPITNEGRRSRASVSPPTQFQVTNMA